MIAFGATLEIRLVYPPFVIFNLEIRSDPGCIGAPLFVTTQISIAVPLGLSAFLTFCVLRTKWSHFYMGLIRQRGTSHHQITRQR